GIALKVEAEGPVPLKGNRELISQALANLIDNAIKYAAPEHAAPELAPTSAVAAAGDPVPPREAVPSIVIAGRSEGGTGLLTGAAAGPGIAAVGRGRVVERFVRLEQSRSHPGAGLGLSLVAAVARLHRGELRLEDNAPGLKATLALPKA